MDLAPAASTLGIFGKAAWCRMLRLYLAVLLARRHGRMALHGAPCSGSPPLPSPTPISCPFLAALGSAAVPGICLRTTASCVQNAVAPHGQASVSAPVRCRWFLVVLIMAVVTFGYGWGGHDWIAARGLIWLHMDWFSDRSADSERFSISFLLIDE